MLLRIAYCETASAGKSRLTGMGSVTRLPGTAQRWCIASSVRGDNHFLLGVARLLATTHRAIIFGAPSAAVTSVARCDRLTTTGDNDRGRKKRAENRLSCFHALSDSTWKIESGFIYFTFPRLPVRHYGRHAGT